MKRTTCRTCGKPLNRAGLNQHGNARCLICRTADTMQTFVYTPDPYAAVLYREDEPHWAARPEVRHAA